jgi:uncharacterized protein (DUF1800 family)
MTHGQRALRISIFAFAFMLTPTDGSAGMEPTEGVVWNVDAARHLLSRTSFGGTLEEARALAKLSLEVAVDRLLNDAESAPPMPRPDWVRDVWANKLRRYDDMPREEYLVMFRRASTRNDEELADLRATWLRTMVRNQAPLRERMTLFWHGYFTSASSKMFAVTQALYQQNVTWRKHALGNFREFLEAATLDPGMLIYLDMEESNKDNPNENYARELLELFSLGVGNYTEKDIREIARAFTGWTLEPPKGFVKQARPTNPETARSMRRDGLVATFVPERHDDGQKTVLGKTGNFGVREVLDLVVSQPACGRHIATRMIDHFGAYDPQDTLKARMAAAFVASGYEIRPMVRVLLTSPEFYAAEARGNRIKSPIRLLVGACRDTKIEGDLSPALAQAIVPLGQELFNPPTVKGWPSGEEWITATTLSLRQRLPEVLIDGQPLTGTEPLGRIRGTLVPRDPVEADKLVKRLLALDEEKLQITNSAGIEAVFRPENLAVSGDTEEMVDRLLADFLVVKPRATTRAAIVDACKLVEPQDRVKMAVRLILASPEYQVE